MGSPDAVKDRRPVWRGILAALFQFCIFGISSPAWAQTDLDESIADLARPLTESGLIVGISIGVIDNGEITTYGFGKTSHDSTDAPDENSVYEIGSITKIFTSLLLAALSEKGIVALDQPVVSLPPFDGLEGQDHADPVTLTHLATHTAGLGRWPEGFVWPIDVLPGASYSSERFYAYMKRILPRSRPGATYSYSNAGYGLLGDLLARAAGTSYEALLEDIVLRPLRLDNTGITLSPAMNRRLTLPHDFWGRPVASVNIPPVMGGAGSVRSSVRDLLGFLQANMESADTPLRSALSLVRETYFTGLGPAPRMGLGWRIKRHNGVLWHTGGTIGYSAHIALDLANRSASVVLANSSTQAVSDLGERIVRLLAGESAARSKLPRLIPVPQSILEDYVGTYDFGVDAALAVTREEDWLFTRIRDNEKIRLYPDSETRFLARIADAWLLFSRGKDRQVSDAYFYYNGAVHRGKRRR